LGLSLSSDKSLDSFLGLNGSLLWLSIFALTCEYLLCLGVLLGELIATCCSGLVTMLGLDRLLEGTLTGCLEGEVNRLGGVLLLLAPGEDWLGSGLDP